MRLYVSATKTKFLMLWALSFLTLAMLLIFAKPCRDGGLNGLFLCLQVLIPSLFPYMVLAEFMSGSGLTRHSGRLAGMISKCLFSLPGGCLPVILLSMIGGYPVGAKGVDAMYRHGLITEGQARRMLYFCVGAGPGFLLTFVGTSLLKNRSAGLLLLISQVVCMTALGIVSRFFRPFMDSDTEAPSQKDSVCTGLSTALVDSVSRAIRATAVMCGFVILFSAVCEITVYITDNSSAAHFMSALLEVTTGCTKLCGNYSLVTVAAVTGFGGICVHFQIYSLTPGLKYSKPLFLLFRLAQGVLNAVVTAVLLVFFPQSEQVFSTTEYTPVPVLYSGIGGCCCLIICCGVFLLFISGMPGGTRRSH